MNETATGGGRLTLKRVRLDGSERSTILCLDVPIPSTSFRPSRIYPLSTISSDGKRLALSCFLGDGSAEGAPYGLVVFDIEEPSVRLVLQGGTWCNIHPQFSRSTDAEESRDILVQENHGNAHDAQGQVTGLTGGAGADIHVIRDDGSDFRTMPWGRGGNERCQGHQCWRGRSTWAITSTGTPSPAEQQLIESQAVADAGHIGSKSPGGMRNHLSAGFADPHPCFHHFGTDIAGRRLVADAGPFGEAGGRLFLFEFGAPGRDAFTHTTYLLSPRCTCTKNTHIHPFLSPGGTMAFFNSDESGVLHAYAVRGVS